MTTTLDACMTEYDGESHHELFAAAPWQDMIQFAMAKKNDTPPKSFEDALRELEQILTEIESGQVGLEESLAKYERGNFLIQHCRSVLTQAEKQIELLSKASDGSLKSEPMEPENG